MFKSIKIEDSVEEQVEIETDDIFIEDDLDKVMFERFWFEWGHILNISRLLYRPWSVIRSFLVGT